MLAAAPPSWCSQALCTDSGRWGVWTRPARQHTMVAMHHRAWQSRGTCEGDVSVGRQVRRRLMIDSWPVAHFAHFTHLGDRSG